MHRNLGHSKLCLRFYDLVEVGFASLTKKLAVKSYYIDLVNKMN